MSDVKALTRTRTMEHSCTRKGVRSAQDGAYACMRGEQGDWNSKDMGRGRNPCGWFSSTAYAFHDEGIGSPRFSSSILSGISEYKQKIPVGDHKRTSKKNVSAEILKSSLERLLISLHRMGKFDFHLSAQSLRDGKMSHDDM